MPIFCAPIKDRIKKNIIIDEVSGCWLWQRRRKTRLNGNYGVISVVIGKRKNKKVHVHRAAYEAFIGPIPENMCVLHTCDNPPCCNPAHLSLGTQAENLMDCIKKGRRKKTRVKETV